MKHDVIIAGASHAGLTVAKKMAEAGYKVIVYEKNREIGYPNYSTAAGDFRDYKELGFTKECFGKFVDRFDFRKSDGTFVSFVSRKNDYGTLYFRESLQYFAMNAIDAGAEIVLGTKIDKSMVEQKKVVGVMCGKDNHYSNIVVDCSGASSVLRASVTDQKFERMAVAVEYLIRTKKLRNDRYTIYLRNLLEAGYGWTVPLTEDLIKVGIGFIPNYTKEKQNLDVLRSTFFKQLGIKDTQAIEIHSGAYSSDGGLGKFCSDGIVLVGDSCAQSSPFIGLGVRTSILSAQLCADTLISSLESEDYSYRKLSEYQKNWEKKFRRNYQIGRLLNYFIGTGDAKRQDKFIDILSGLDGDDIYNVFSTNFTAVNLKKFVPLLGKSILKFI